MFLPKLETLGDICKIGIKNLTNLLVFPYCLIISGVIFFYKERFYSFPGFLYLSMYSSSYLKIGILLTTQSKYDDDFLHLNLSPSYRKTVAFLSLQLYITKLIAGLIVINTVFPLISAPGAN